jgi:hypothetical protein
VRGRRRCWPPAAVATRCDCRRPEPGARGRSERHARRHRDAGKGCEGGRCGGRAKSGAGRQRGRAGRQQRRRAAPVRHWQQAPPYVEQQREGECARKGAKERRGAAPPSSHAGLSGTRRAPQRKRARRSKQRQPPRGAPQQGAPQGAARRGRFAWATGN